MIETTEYEKIPATILHRVTGELDVEGVKRGISEASEVISRVVHRYGNFNLIIDPREHKFTDLQAHKMWKLWSQSGLVKGKVNYIAIIVHDSPHTRAEKELLETEKLQFFFNFDAGIDWLRNVVVVEKKA